MVDIIIDIIAATMEGLTGHDWAERRRRKRHERQRQRKFRRTGARMPELLQDLKSKLDSSFRCGYLQCLQFD